MVRKFFPLDKNYLLEAAQLEVREILLSELTAKSKSIYGLMHNPLGLNDVFSEQIKLFRPQRFTPLHTFYENLAGIYRYKFGQNQLDFLWDGRDHTEKYREDWASTFDAWTDQLCRLPQFVQAVLDLTVFLPEEEETHLAESRMNAVMLNMFDVRIHRQKGIVKMRVA